MFKFRGQLLIFSELPRFGSLGVAFAQLRILSHMRMRMKDALEGSKIDQETSGLISLLCCSLPNGLNTPMEIQVAALP